MKKHHNVFKFILSLLFILMALTGTVVFILYEMGIVKKEVVIEAGTEARPSDFLNRPDPKASFTDDSDDIDITKPGEYKVKIHTGLFNHPSKLIIKDTKDPEVSAVEEVRLKLGQNISYKSYITASDTCPEGLRIDVDSSEVNLNAEGTYTVNITATDSSGNSAKTSMRVVIYDSAYFEEDLWNVTDPVLEKIFTPEMTDRDKIAAIYRYVFNNCRYTLSPNDTDWIKAAVDGFNTGKGDCFTDTCMTRALLTRAGYKNMVIFRVKNDANDHYWNLVDIDDGHGWYHLDCINRGDGHKEWEIILFTDEQIKEVDKYIGDYHDYDRSKFPVIL